MLLGGSDWTLVWVRVGFETKRINRSRRSSGKHATWNSVYVGATAVTRTVCLEMVKVKGTLVQALRLCTDRTANKGSRGIALLFLDHCIRRGEGSASRPGRSLPPGKTRYPLCRRLGGLQGRSGQVRKISPPQGFDPRTVQPVASRYTD